MLAVARRHFPRALLVLPVGGGEEAFVYGQDNTALVAEARKTGTHIRSTHGGYQPFAQNVSTMLRRIATACKQYGVPFWTEPPGGISPAGEVARFMEAVSCASWGFWDWGQNPVGAADTFREYRAYLTREQPVVDTALLFPTTDHRLRPTQGYPPQLASLGPLLRDGPLRKPDERAVLEAGHQALLRALHDLDLDWAVGKLSEDDYHSQRSHLLAEASAVLRRLGRASHEAES